MMSMLDQAASSVQLVGLTSSTRRAQSAAGNLVGVLREYFVERRKSLSVPNFDQITLKGLGTQMRQDLIINNCQAQHIRT